MLIKILLAGDGGQGIQSLSEIICRAAFAHNLFVSHIPNYGLEQRGGVSLAYVQISDQNIAYPKFSVPDLLLVMSEQADERTREYRSKGCRILNFEAYKKNLLTAGVDFSSQNIFFLGMIARLLAEKNILRKEHVFAILKEKLSKKNNWEKNQQAFDLGFNTKM